MRSTRRSWRSRRRGYPDETLSHELRTPNVALRIYISTVSFAGAMRSSTKYSTRGSAGIARAARCCGSGTSGRRADRGRTPASRAAVDVALHRARRLRSSFSSTFQIAWCTVRPCGLCSSAASRHVERLRRRARSRARCRPSARRARQSCGFAAISRRQRSSNRCGVSLLLRSSALEPIERQVGALGRDARSSRSQAASAPLRGRPGMSRTSPRLRYAGVVSGSRSIADWKCRAASSAIAAPAAPRVPSSFSRNARIAWLRGCVSGPLSATSCLRMRCASAHWCCSSCSFCR